LDIPVPRLVHTHEVPGFEGESEPASLHSSLPPQKNGPRPAADWRSDRSTRTTTKPANTTGDIARFSLLFQGDQRIQRPNGLGPWYLRLRPASTPPSISLVEATTRSCPTRSKWGTMGSNIATATTSVTPMTRGLLATAVQPLLEMRRNAATSTCFASSTYDPAHCAPGYGLGQPTHLTKRALRDS
jgi:hypothetical protein